MPELPEVEAVRRELAAVMTGTRFDRVTLRRPDLRTLFPERFGERLQGHTVRALNRRGKYLLGDLSSGETLLMHLGMSGSFRIGVEGHGARTAEPPEAHDHVVFEMSSGAVVTFNDPRRFGVMDLVPVGTLANHPVLSKLGPEPLSAEFNASTLARACQQRTVSLKVALLDQRVVAGLGNIYASDVLNLARLSPQRRAMTIATPSGLPRDGASRLTLAIKRVLTRAIERVANPRYRSARFRVYDRAGQRCPNEDCGGMIRRLEQAGRSTFYCPRCQR